LRSNTEGRANDGLCNFRTASSQRNPRSIEEVPTVTAVATDATFPFTPIPFTTTITVSTTVATFTITAATVTTTITTTWTTLA
jgi:hypothetical protein